ncbi:MAG: PH domain-containing protein [Gallionella sp.]|nr:PH domain-containing protein [Gallionella sp.]
MIFNAEFQRNIWLEINFPRLITIPLVLALVFWAFFMSNANSDVSIDEMGTHLSNAALSLFSIITILWGTQLASHSLTEEAQAQTWDWQRLSAQSPTALIFGKLFGSTILAWYGGICCLIVYMLFANSTLDGIRVEWLVLAIFSAIFVHASAMLLTLTTPPEQRPAYQQKHGMSFAKMFMLLMALYGSGMLLLSWTNDNLANIHWYGMEFKLLPFSAWSMFIWALWAVFGCIKRTSTLLRSPTTPAAWLTFVLFCMVYFVGFTPASTTPVDDFITHTKGGIAFTVIYCLLCGMTLMEDKAPLQWRLWIDAFKNKEFKHAWQNTPRWIATFFISILILLIALPGSSPDVRIFLPVALFLFMRDIAVLYWFHWTPQPKRPYLAFSIYLLLVYLLLPFLFRPLNWLFYPKADTPVITLVVFFVEAIVAMAFLLQRWEQYFSAEFIRDEEEEILQNSLVENEKVIYAARISIGIQAPLFLSGLGIIALGFLMHFYSPIANANTLDNALLWAAMLGGLGCWLWAFVRHIFARRNTQLTFTNKRVIVKIGFPLQQNIELPLGKIGSIQVTQTQRGRIFNYGNIIINSIGNPQITVPDIANPSQFRRTLMEAQPH